jgi:hypothetical protein
MNNKLLFGLAFFVCLTGMLFAAERVVLCEELYQEG